MAIHIFHCRSDPAWFALTKDRGGKGLPAELAPWRTVQRNAICATMNAAAAAALLDGRIARTIATDGFYLFRDSLDS
jgi:hypothetical protein